MTDPAVWLYAVRPAAAPAVPAGLSGVAGEPVRSVCHGDLEAVVGTLPPSLAAQDGVQARLADPVWLEQAVRRHHHVVDTLFRAAATVPFRLATIYRGDHRVVELLETRAAALRPALETATGRAEWGVRAYPLPAGTPAGPGAPAGTPAAPGTPADSASSAGRGAAAEAGAATGSGAAAGTAVATAPTTGTAYLLRRRTELAAREQARAEAAAEAAELEATLSQWAVAVRRLSTDHGADEPVPAVSNVSYLVEQSRAADFVACAHRLRERLPRLRLRITGPWPPYSFVELPG